MLLTEAEAKTKVCPFMTHHLIEKCIASQCMMWRQHLKYAEPKNPLDAWPLTSASNLGYCGLAGKLGAT